ncbi:hypothetical protein [Peristeroidobacter soli]|jgi:DNA-binding transcriptional MerR regulator|uniref:hypothetical protein n=1 Tax=Peristeroidobacter soli TaxID=2497877 RepID=UPI00101D1B5B|nr:hypothetical protein [Peristeroidobacter soli]
MANGAGGKFVNKCFGGPSSQQLLTKRCCAFATATLSCLSHRLPEFNGESVPPNHPAQRLLIGSASMTAFKGVLVAMVAVAAMGAAGPVAAQARERQLTEEQRAQIEARLAEVRKRLDLSAEQEAKLEPILRDSFAKRLALLDSYGLSRDGAERPSLRQMQALGGEMADIREATEKQVATVLDQRQMAEFRKIQDEMREQIRARIRERKR